jgi:hypothetical protein
MVEAVTTEVVVEHEADLDICAMVARPIANPRCAQ